MTLLTGLCVTLALVAITLAATSSLATAESGPMPAMFAVGEDETVISGTVVGVGDAMIGIQEADGVEPVAFPVVAGATMSRAGAPVALTDLRQHDPVHLTVNRISGAVLQIVAEPAPGPVFQPSNQLAAFAVLGLIAGAMALMLNGQRARLVTTRSDSNSIHVERPARRLGLSHLSLSPDFQRHQADYPA